MVLVDLVGAAAMRFGFGLVLLLAFNVSLSFILNPVTPLEVTAYLAWCAFSGAAYGFADARMDDL